MLDQCLWLLDHQEIRDNAALTFLHPVLLYLFCDPNYHHHFGAMRAALFDRLIDSCGSLEDEDSCQFSCLRQLMTWLQFDQKASLPELAGYVVKFFTFLLGKGGETTANHIR